MSLFQAPVKITGTQVNTGMIAGQSINSTSNLEIIIDNTTIQKIGLRNIVSQQPTTSGTPLNDNLARLPILYQIEGYLSTSTINGQNILSSTFSSLSASPASTYPSSYAYIGSRIQQLQTALMNPYIFKISSPIISYPSMALLNCDIEQTYEAINAIKIILTMQELLLAPNVSAQTQSNSNVAPFNRGNQNA